MSSSVTKRACYFQKEKAVDPLINEVAQGLSFGGGMMDGWGFSTICDEQSGVPLSTRYKYCFVLNVIKQMPADFSMYPRTSKNMACKRNCSLYPPLRKPVGCVVEQRRRAMQWEMQAQMQQAGN